MISGDNQKTDDFTLASAVQFTLKNRERRGKRSKIKKLSQELCEAKFWVRVRVGKAGQIKDNSRAWSEEGDGL